MAVASRERMTASALNPNAPLFIPAAYQQVEDFSPEWWNLVHSSPWFRDYWLRERHQDDINNIIPNEFADTNNFPDHDFAEDLDEFTELELQLEEAVLRAIDGDDQPQQQCSQLSEFVQGLGNESWEAPSSQ